MIKFNSPKIAYNHALDKIVIYFYYNDFPNQQQSFELDVNALIKAYYIDKKHLAQLMCDYAGKNDKRILNVLDFVIINPTIIRKAVHQNKKKARKFDLQIKAQFDPSFSKGSRKSAHDYSQRKVDLEEVERCKHNMNVAVLKARKFDAYQPFFNQFLDAYKELTFAEKGTCINIGPRLYTKLFNSFRNLIDFNEDVKL